MKRFTAVGISENKGGKSHVKNKLNEVGPATQIDAQGRKIGLNQ